MNKKEFMQQLKNELKHLQKDELDELLYDYEEHFRIGKEKKKTEQHIAKTLGNPKTIAKHILANHYVKKAEDKKSAYNIVRAIFAAAGIGFLNLFFVLGPFIAIIAILIALFAVSLALTFSGIAVFVASILVFLGVAYPLGIHTLGALLVGIGICCLGILFFIGTCYLVKGIYKLSLAYLKLNIAVIKGGNEK